MSDARVAVMPNVVLAGGRGTAPVLERASPAALRLDQVGAVSRLADQAEHGAIEPADGLRRLDHIGDLRHRFGAVGVVGGHAVLTVGLALILQPTPVALVTATVFGTLIGVLKLYAGHMATAQILMPVCAAILVSWLAFAVAPEKTTDASMRVLIPALVTFLPGSLLTTATLDLAAGEVISGSSRLVAGVMQLVLLSFGMVVGVELSGVPLDEAITNTAQNTLGDWAPWLGVIVFGLGAFVHFSGPPHALGWLLLVLLSAYVGQQLGGHLVSKDLSGFTGALLVTVVAAWVARRPTGPPQMATFLPAFWLLVPGAVGLIGMAEFVGTDREAGLDHFVHMIDTFIAIGLGVLVGNALVLRFTRGSSAPRAHARSARAER